MSQSAPDSHAPSSPPPQEEAQNFASVDDVIILEPSAQEGKADDIDVSHEMHVKKEVPSERIAPEEKVANNVETAEQVVPSPLRNATDMPSKPSVEEEEREDEDEPSAT